MSFQRNNKKNKYRIMHVVDSLAVGGMENGVVNIVNMIDNNRFDPFICCLSKLGKLSGRITNKNVSIIALNWKGGFQPKLFFDLMKLFRKEKIDIVHSHGWLTFIYSSIASRLAGVPILIDGEHGTFHLEKRRRKIAFKILSFMVDKFITVSDSLKSELHETMNIAVDKILSIHNGVDLEKFSPKSDDEIMGIRKRFGIPDKSLIVGSVGRLEPVKNYEMLVRAIAALNREHESLYCILVGEGICRTNLEKLSVELGVDDKIKFPGNVDDVQNVLSVMDIFVLTSKSEGLSNTMLEAMSCGKPLVVTDVGGNRELIREDHNGFFVKSNDELELVRKIKNLLADRDKREMFGKNSRVIAETDFSLSKMVYNYENVYKECFFKK